MEIAARFIAPAHRDLPFLEYSREFCRLAAATALDDATILSLFWHGANSHRPVDLPDTTGLKWREGILRCLESVRPRARTSLPSSAAPPSPPTRPADLPYRPAENMASPICLYRQSSPVPAPRLLPPEPLLVPSSSPEPLLVPSSSPEGPPVAAPRQCPPVRTPEPAPRQRTPEPAPRQRTPEPAPLQRPQVPAPVERPQVPTLAERPQVPAPAERPQESALPERPQESMPPVRPLMPDGALISPKEIFGGRGGSRAPAERTEVEAGAAVLEAVPPWPPESPDPPWPPDLPAPPWLPERAPPWRPPVLSCLHVP